MDFAGAGFSSDLPELFERTPLAKDQTGPPLLQVSRQRLKTAMEPPATGAPRLPGLFLIWTVNVDGDDLMACRQGSLQGRMIGQAQVTAKPDDGNAHATVPWAGRRVWRNVCADSRIAVRAASGRASRLRTC